MKNITKDVGKKSVRGVARGSVLWHGIAATRTGILGLAAQFDEVSVPFFNNAILDDWFGLESVAIPEDVFPQLVNWMNETFPFMHTPAEAPALFFYAWCAYNIGATAVSLTLLKKAKSADSVPTPV